jgi:DMSO/TMAO reductase YedYZ molybdopterin-dependent catalytic subunit
MPKIDPAAYRLQVDGLVDKPATFTLDDLKAMPKAEQVSDFHCVTGWVVKNVRWGGVRLHTLLSQVGPTKDAKAIRFVSAEVPYDDALTMQQAFLPDVMLAYEMDGKPLPRPHGAPVRLVMPEMYGYKSVKWVNRLELTKVAPWGYWEQNGYDVDAWIGRSNGL